MASSQKFMAYIVPVFALSGLYWQFGLVLYWLTTNLWTLGQQHVLFKRFPPLTPAGKAGAAPASGAAGGAGTVAKKSGQAPAKAPVRPTGKAPVRPTGKVPVNQLRGTSKQSGAAAPGKPATGSQPSGAVPKATTPSANGSAGGAGSGGAGGALRRLVKGRPEPEPEPAPTETKLVRQQPVRQPRSRRSGKR
jgi:YidC/Oxa1 family membrane protein insertase